MPFADTQKPTHTGQALHRALPFASNPKAHPLATCMTFFPADQDFSSPHRTGCTRAGVMHGANSGSSTAPSPGQFPPYTQGLESILTPQHRLTTKISVPRHSASACRTNLFLILRWSSIAARMSFCLPIVVELPFKWCQRRKQQLTKPQQGFFPSRAAFAYK